MRRTILVWVLGVACWGGEACCAQQRPLPHIVIYLADDLGMANLRAYNPASTVPTPEIDRLAAEGCRFVDAHSSAAVCTPSRFGLLTGRYPLRSRLSKSVLESAYDPPLLRGEPETIAGMLRRAGYATLAFGKWHLGAEYRNLRGDGVARPGVGTSKFSTRDVDFSQPARHLPVDHGFDHFFGLSSSINHDPYLFVRNDRAVTLPTRFRQEFAPPGGGGPFREGWIGDGWDDRQTCPRILDAAVAEIGRRLRERPQQPLFVYYASPAPHFPWVPPDRVRGRPVHGAGGDDHQAPRFNDMVVMNDIEVGALRRVFEDAGGAFDQTLFILTSDNGAAQGYFEPYSGKKASISEGGHRVPFIVRWPGEVEPGSRSAALFGLHDLYATLAALTQTPLAPGAATDSRNLVDALRGGATGAEDLVVQRAGAAAVFAYRQGAWKLIVGAAAAPLLFDLDADPGESRNVASEHPQRVQQMQARLKEQLTAL